MKRNLKKALAKVLASVIVFSMVLGAMPALNASAAVKPKLSAKTLNVTVKKTKSLKVTKVKAKQIKKTTWSVRNKKVASLTKKKKNSVTVKGVKKGSTVVTAKVKVGKKTTTIKCTIKVAAATKPPTKKPVTPKPATTAPATQKPATTAPVTTAPATVAPTNPPLELTDNPFVVDLTPSNLSRDLDESYYSDPGFPGNPPGSEGYKYTSNSQYNSGMMFYLNDGSTADISDYDYVEYTVKDMKDVETSLKFWTGTSWYDGKQEAFEGSSNISGAERTIIMPLSKINQNLETIKCIGVAVQDNQGKSAWVTSIKLCKYEGDQYVHKSVAKELSVKTAGSSKKVAEQGTLQFAAEIYNKNHVQIEGEIKWSSENPAIATVNETTGLVTGVATGKVNIIAEVVGLEPTVSGVFELEVYNNDPVDSKLFSTIGYETNVLTLDELSGNGLEFTGVTVNGNGDVVDFIADSQITIESAGTTGATLTDNKLKATAEGVLTLKLAAVSGYTAKEVEFAVVKGHRVPIDSKITNESESRATVPATFKIGTNLITMGEGTADKWNVGFGVNVATLPNSKKVEDIKGVRFAYTQTGTNSQNQFKAFAQQDFVATAEGDASGLAWGYLGTEASLLATATDDTKGRGIFQTGTPSAENQTATFASGIMEMTFHYDTFTHDATSTKMHFGITPKDWNSRGVLTVSDIVLLYN